MGNFTLKNILPANDTAFSKGVYIILFNATSIPPHLLLAVEGKVYSITDSGRQLGSPLEKLILFIRRKTVPTLFVEWKELGSCSGESLREKVGKLESLVREIFMKYDRVSEGKVSCLFPIRDVTAEVLGNEMGKADFIFELLPLMEKENALGKIFFLNMESDIVNGEFELLTYSEIELKETLQSSQLPKTEKP